VREFHDFFIPLGNFLFGHFSSRHLSPSLPPVTNPLPLLLLRPFISACQVLAIVAGVPIVHPNFAEAILHRTKLSDPLPDPQQYALPSELPAALGPCQDEVGLKEWWRYELEL